MAPYACAGQMYSLLQKPLHKHFGIDHPYAVAGSLKHSCHSVQMTAVVLLAGTHAPVQHAYATHRLSEQLHIAISGRMHSHS